MGMWIGCGRVWIGRVDGDVDWMWTGVSVESDETWMGVIMWIRCEQNGLRTGVDGVWTGCGRVWRK